jgi:hypothetical protein
MELLAGGHGIGYLLKSRVTDVADFIETGLDPACLDTLDPGFQPGEAR